MANRFDDPVPQALDNAGTSLAAAQLFFFEAGTSTPLDTFSDEALTPGNENANPVVADSAGRFSDIFLKSQDYKVQLKTSVITGSSEIWERDPVNSVIASSIDFLSSLTGAVSRPLQSKLEDIVSVFDFMTTAQIADVKAATASIDVTLPIQAAIDALTTGGTVLMPVGVYKTTATLIDNTKTILLRGQGCNENPATSGDATTIKPVGAITAIKFDGNRSGGRDFHVDGDSGAADTISHGIHSRSARAQWENIVVQNCRGDGVRHSLGNSSSFRYITSLSNGQHGFNVDGTGEASPNDANASTYIGIDCRTNGGIGFRSGVNSTFANYIYGLSCQGNISFGLEINGDFYKIYGIHLEDNDDASTPSFDIHWGTTADRNQIYGFFSNYPNVPDATSGVVLDDSTNGTSFVQDITGFSTTFRAQTFEIGSPTAGIAGFVKFEGDDGTNPSITLAGTSGTQTLQITSEGAGTFGINPDFIEQEAVTAPTLLNSWVDFGGSRQPAGFYKDKSGVVHIRGVIKSGTTANPTQLFLLPSGSRPSNREKFALVSNNAFASGFIDSNGQVFFEVGSNVEFSISGMSFRT